MHHTNTLAFLLMFAVAIGLPGCGSNEKAESGGSTSGADGADGGSTAAGKLETPQAAFEAFAAAAKKEDWSSMARVMVPKDQTMLAGTGMMMASFATMNDKAREQSLEALLKKHGIDINDDSEPTATDMESAMEESLAPVKDKPAFIAEIMNWISKNADDKEGLPFAQIEKLQNLKVDGDSATGTVSTPMGDQPIEFVKMDGSWRVSLPRDSGPGGDGGGGLPEEDFTVVDPEEPLAGPGEGSGTYGVLRVDDHAYRLGHAVAYKSEFFDDPATVVLLTSNPLDDRTRNRLIEALKNDGNDDSFFARGVHLKLTFDDAGKIVSLFGWADNLSINSSSVPGEAKVENGRFVGKAALPEPKTLFGDSSYQFNVVFDAEMVSAE